MGRGGGGGAGRGRGRGKKGVVAENIAPAVPAKPRLTPGKRGPPPPVHAKGTLPSVLSNKRPDIIVEIIEVHSESDPTVGRSDQGESSSRIDSEGIGFIEVPSEHSEAPELQHGASALLTSNVYVRTHAQGRAAMWSVEPRYVILYDMELASVRQCECFRAARPGSPLRLYALIFENCAEERAYADSVLKENDAFEALIEEKARLAVRNCPEKAITLEED